MIISRTPLRISFVGGGTDFETYYRVAKGLVISTTIDKYIYVTVNKKFDNKIHVRYSGIECVDNLSDLKHNIVREALKEVGIGKGIEITIISDVPSQGSGLGSSSSLAVGLLKALYWYKGYNILPEELAHKACELEINTIQSPIGRQDQYAASFGGFNIINFTSSGITVSNLYGQSNGEKTRWLQEAVMLFYLGGRDSNSILETHKKNIYDKWPELDGQKGLALEFLLWLTHSENNEFAGSFLDRGWELKRAITPQASSESIDLLMKSIKEAGAYGGKLCGAGGGGFLMVLCEPDKQFMVRKALSHLPELKFNFEKEGSKIIHE